MPRGGKRAGAGRKKGKDWDGGGKHQKRIRRLFGLTPDNFEWLQSQSEKLDISQADVLNSAICTARNLEQAGTLAGVPNRLILSEMHEGPLVAAKK